MIRHSALVLAFLGVALFQKVDWRWRVSGLPPGPPPQPTVIVLSSPARDDGFLRKAPQPRTNDLGAWALFLDGKVVGPYLFTVTAYNERDPYTPGTVTASGLPVMEGITVACGPEIALGAVIVLENGMILRCLDRGGWITEGRLDIYFDELSKAERFGIQRIRGVVILEEGK